MLLIRKTNRKTTKQMSSGSFQSEPKNIFLFEITLADGEGEVAAISNEGDRSWASLNHLSSRIILIWGTGS